MKILFLHGWHSVPGGVKPTYLATNGHRLVEPALSDDDGVIETGNDHRLADPDSLKAMLKACLNVY